MVTTQLNEKWRRISGLVRGANIFLFGLVPGGQSAAYRYLKIEKNFCDENGSQYRGSYASVLDDIINKNQGIKRLVYEIIIDLAKNEFGDPLADGKSSLKFLEEYWEKGEPPEKNEIEKDGIELIHWHSWKEYKDRYTKEKYGKTGTGSCTLLDITKVGEKWVIRFSEFCKLWYTELAELDQLRNQAADDGLNISENNTLVGYSKNLDNLAPAKISTPDVDLTNRFFKVLETLPYDLSGENYQKMITKILALTSISKLPETKPIYDQLSKIIDFGRMMALVTIGEGNSRIGGSKK